MKQNPEYLILIAIVLFLAFQISRAIASHNKPSLIECTTFYPSDEVCEKCESILTGRIVPRYDYEVDIHDDGSGLCVLREVQTGQVYVVPFDELQETIEKLNE